VTDTPRPDELTSLIDEALRVVDERFAISPGARIYDSLKAQLTYVRRVVHGEQPRDAADDDRLLLGRYAAREFETSDPAFADVLSKIQYLYDRFPASETARAARPAKRPGILIVAGAVLIAATMIGSGVFLLVQRQTGTRAVATVGDCETRGGGRYRSVHCTGTWVIGGPLIGGGHVVFGTIDGVDTDAVGKTIEVTLRGDTAYARGLALPLLLIGLGLIPGAGAVLFVRALLRPRSRNGSGPSQVRDLDI
jgi:Tse6 toxin immunity protein Tsi6